MKILDNISLTASLLLIILFILAAIGWVMNLYKLTQCDFEPSYKAEVVRVVGIVPVVGAVTGWIDLGK